jgi:uncharacterized membrane protein
MKRLRLSSKDLALTAIFAALYATLVLTLTGISFQLVQVRVADVLIPLSIFFGWPTIIGVAIGGAVANVASPMPSVIVDLSFGSIANFIASLLAWKISRLKLISEVLREFLGCVASTIVITLIVGTYLAILTDMELWVWWLGIGVGSVISINILGFALIQLLKKILGKPRYT